MTERKSTERIPLHLIHQVRFVTRSLNLTREVKWMRRLVTGLSLRRTAFNSRWVRVGFVVQKVALGQVFDRILWFFHVSNFQRYIVTDAIWSQYLTASLDYMLYKNEQFLQDWNQLPLLTVKWKIFMKEFMNLQIPKKIWLLQLEWNKLTTFTTNICLGINKTDALLRHCTGVDES